MTRNFSIWTELKWKLLDFVRGAREFRDDFRHDKSWRRAKKQRKAREKAYQAHHLSDLKALPAMRRRSLSLLAEGIEAHQSAKRGSRRPRGSSRPECRLLSLPVELRILIWENVITGNHIGLYRDNGRLTHVLLDHSNTRTPGELLAITPESIRNEVARLTEYSDGVSSCPPRGTKAKLSPLLKTCRTMLVRICRHSTLC